jgi:hypothetical protein
MTHHRMRPSSSGAPENSRPSWPLNQDRRLPSEIILAELDCNGWSKVLYFPGKLEPQLLAEFNQFSHLEQGL